jgi:hypothetical protein
LLDSLLQEDFREDLRRTREWEWVLRRSESLGVRKEREVSSG